MLSAEEMERYQRQILIIGKENQEKLKSKTVLQVGAGGLGSPLALYLVAAGIGNLILYEQDRVSLSNLGRQILYQTSEVNQAKGDLAKQKLEALNPHAKVIVKKKWLTLEEGNQILNKYSVDYLVDASDNFKTKFLINDLGIKHNIPFTIAGIEGFDGQLLSVNPKKSACYRCLFQDVPESPSNAPIPVMSPTCGVLGSLEANEVIKGLLNKGNRILNSLLMISLETGDFNKISFKINPTCTCQK